MPGVAATFCTASPGAEQNALFGGVVEQHHNACTHRIAACTIAVHFLLAVGFMNLPTCPRSFIAPSPPSLLPPYYMGRNRTGMNIGVLPYYYVYYIDRRNSRLAFAALCHRLALALPEHSCILYLLLLTQHLTDRLHDRTTRARRARGAL